jgi:hypothetical protein
MFYIFQFLTSKTDLESNAKGFELKCNFPNCLSTVDGKHVATAPLTRAGAFFCTYKVYSSQELVVKSDLNYDFIHFYFGTNDHVSDGGVLEYTDFYKLGSGCLKIPESSDVKGKTMPYGFNGE